MNSTEPNEPIIVSHGVQKFLFVASHGLRSSLTSIRWASKRLQRSSIDTLSADQQRFISQIHIHSARLARTLNSMLLTARIEEKMYKVHLSDIPLCVLLQKITHRLLKNEEETSSIHWEIVCDAAVTIRQDEQSVETLLSDVLAGCLDATPDGKIIAITVTPSTTDIQIDIIAELELAMLSSKKALNSSMALPAEGEAIGGTPGLLFSLANTMIKTLNGKFTITEIPEGTYRITLLIPSLSSSAH